MPGCAPSQHVHKYFCSEWMVPDQWCLDVLCTSEGDQERLPGGSDADAGVSEKEGKKYQIQMEQNNGSTVLLAEAELRVRLRNLNFTVKTLQHLQDYKQRSYKTKFI